MVDIMDRRVTRSLSSEIARAQSKVYLRHEVSTYSQQQQNHSTHQNEQGDHGFSGSNHTVGTPSYMRNTSDEFLLCNLMESSLVSSTSGQLEGLNFLDPLQPSDTGHTSRGNSEELFRSWISASTTTETSTVGFNYNDSPGGGRPRRRISSELQAIIAQQNGSNLYIRSDIVDQTYLQNPFLPEDIGGNDDNQRHRGALSKETGGAGQAQPDYSSHFSAFRNIPWFNTTSPMTRSRSSELQRKYAQMEGLPFPPSAEALQKLVIRSNFDMNPAVGALGAFAHARGVNNNGSPPQKAASPPISPATVTNVNTQFHQANGNEGQGNVVSAVVSLLKCSLERRKLSGKQQQQQTQQPGARLSISHGDDSSGQDASTLQMSQLPMDSTTGLMNDNSHSPPVAINNNANSPSESSGGGPAHSASLTTSDGPSNSGMSVHRQGLKRGNLSVDQPSPKRHHTGFDVPSPSSNSQSICEMYDGGTTKSDLRKKGDEHLTRAGSVTSSIRSGFQTSEIDDATKKRRVERQKKMQEQKGRGNAPPMPPDMQAAVKRCDVLEKENRSLKLNLSFMNRKDSEQTKRIEELEKLNEELQEQLDRLSSMNDSLCNS